MSSVTPQQYMVSWNFLFKSIILFHLKTNSTSKENWLLQINYPEISVRLDNSGAVTRVNFRQIRYLLNEDEIPGVDTESPFGYKWLIYCNNFWIKFFL